MSRGGGWGGGGGKNDLGKMGGQALPWEYDPELEGKLNTKPSEKFPVRTTSPSLLYFFYKVSLTPLKTTANPTTDSRPTHPL
jgi:hypothetical protein